VSDDQQADEIRRLEALVATGAGALAFPALAEAWRRAGRPEDAERVARDGLERAPHAAAGRVALALALLDQKRPAEAGAELERLLGGGAEHGIAHEAAASAGPEGLEAPEPRGELATLDPYPDLEPLRPGLDRGREDTEDPGEAVAFEPPAAGPFGPAPPPAPASPESFGADAAEIEDAFDDAEARAPRRFSSDGEGDGALDDSDSRAPQMFSGDVGDDELDGALDDSGSRAPQMFSGDVGDDELDTAFDEAESDAEQMFGADDVARAALATVPDEEDGEAELEPPPPVDVADGEEAFRATPGSPFATETVAGLLERQGHAEEAGRLREQMAGAGPAAETGSAAPPPETSPGAGSTADAGTTPPSNRNGGRFLPNTCGSVTESVARRDVVSSGRHPCAP